MPVFFIDTNFKKDHPVPAEVREKHLAYIGRNRASLRFGGLKQPAGEPVSGICYFVMAEDVVTATNFVKSDPYHPFYSRVDVQEFVQRIP